MFTLENYLTSFTGSLIPHAVLAVYLLVIMGTRGRRVLKKLPALLLSPLLATLLGAGLYALHPNHGLARFCVTTLAILLMCTLWVRWAWRAEFWRAFSAVCMGGVFQMATSCLSQILILYSDLPLAAVMAVNLIMLNTVVTIRTGSDVIRLTAQQAALSDLRSSGVYATMYAGSFKNWHKENLDGTLKALRELGNLR